MRREGALGRRDRRGRGNGHHPERACEDKPLNLAGQELQYVAMKEGGKDEAGANREQGGQSRCGNEVAREEWGEEEEEREEGKAPSQKRDETTLVQRVPAVGAPKSRRPL